LQIGIAGRTGCGKSTLMMAIFRIVEPCGGRLTVDGINVLQIGLRDLRSKLALVPQDPVIFSGTVRSNLDPFGHHSDQQLWESLSKASHQPFFTSSFVVH
jgi:ATP-binding cassette subfamily C (CFTR/MRP) protein 1